MNNDERTRGHEEGGVVRQAGNLRSDDRFYVEIMAKILDRSALKSRLAALRGNAPVPSRVIFTNGCFDIIHRGHIAYLCRARSLGDILVIAVNDDDSVKRLKGPLRPVKSCADRMLELASFQFVDYVFPFAEDTPIRSLELLKPDVHVKGGDYEAEKLPEFATVTGYGGKIAIIPFVDGYSTTSIIRKIEELSDV